MNIYLIGDASDVKFSTVFDHRLYFSTPGLPNDLRVSIAELTTCDAVVLLDDWWTTAEGHILQTIAAWLKLKVVDLQGNSLPTVSLRG